jgi:hypothetical protein
MRGRPEGWLGHGLSARPSGENGPHAHGNARARHAHGVVTVRGSRARRHGDELDDGAVGAGRWQGAAGGHWRGPGVAPGRWSGGGAHPSGGSMRGVRVAASTQRRWPAAGTRGLR